MTKPESRSQTSCETIAAGRIELEGTGSFSQTPELELEMMPDKLEIRTVQVRARNHLRSLMHSHGPSPAPFSGHRDANRVKRGMFLHMNRFQKTFVCLYSNKVE